MPGILSLFTYPKCLEQCLAHNKCLLNEYMKSSSHTGLRCCVCINILKHIFYFWNKPSLFVRKWYCCHCLSVLSSKTKNCKRSNIWEQRRYFLSYKFFKWQELSYFINLFPKPSTRNTLYPLVKVETEAIKIITDTF